MSEETAVVETAEVAPVETAIEETGIAPETVVEPAEKMVPLKGQLAEKTKRQAAEARARQLEIEAAELRGRLSAVAKPVEQAAPQELQAPVKPKSDQFNSWEEFEVAETRYEAAREQYLINKATAEARKTFQQESAAVSQRRAAESAQQTFQERLATASELDPELVDIANTYHLPASPHHLPLSQVMAESIKESEVGPELLRYLANNKKQAAKIAEMGVVAAAREIGKIEAAIQAKPATPPAKISMAPAPITTVTPKGAVNSFDPSTASADDYAKIRLAQLYPGRKT